MESEWAVGWEGGEWKKSVRVLRYSRNKVGMPAILLFRTAQNSVWEEKLEDTERTKKGGMGDDLNKSACCKAKILKIPFKLSTFKTSFPPSSSKVRCFSGKSVNPILKAPLLMLWAVSGPRLPSGNLTLIIIQTFLVVNLTTAKRNKKRELDQRKMCENTVQSCVWNIYLAGLSFSSKPHLSLIISTKDKCLVGGFMPRLLTKRRVGKEISDFLRLNDWMFAMWRG
jgi:hypothetical protein